MLIIIAILLFLILISKPEGRATVKAILRWITNWALPIIGSGLMPAVIMYATVHYRSELTSPGDPPTPVSTAIFIGVFAECVYFWLIREIYRLWTKGPTKTERVGLWILAILVALSGGMWLVGLAAPRTDTNNQSAKKIAPPATAVHLSPKEQEALDWVKCNGVTIGYIPITGSATCPARQFTQLSPKEQEAVTWLRRVSPLCGYAVRADIASITDYRRQDQLTNKEKEAIAWMRKVAPVSGFLLTSDIESTQTSDKHAFGTGFFVTSEGHILTNNHVVDACKTLATRDGKPLRLISRNLSSDLALLKADTTSDIQGLPPGALVELASTSVAVFRTGSAPKLGDTVVAFGFPLPDLLSSGGNVATGILSATSGLQDDVRFVQISAPVQPGNSGGPLLDQSGHVIGVVVAKLDTLRVARAIGDIPQNVNFAVQWSEVRAFLDEERVPYREATSQQDISTPDVAALARRMSVAIDCTE